MKPEGISFEQAASVPLAGVTALHTLKEVAKIKNGDRVLIVGASGGVGSIAIQIAKSFGAHVTAVCSGEKLDMVLGLKPDKVIDYQKEDCAQGSVKYDIILDAAASRPMTHYKNILAEEATYAMVGGSNKQMYQMMLQSLNPFKSKKMKMVLSMPNRKKLEHLNILLKEQG